MAREESFFDDLARGLADGSLSRGKALRLMGAALVGGTLGSLGIGEAAGDPPGCKRNGKHCTRPDQCCSLNCSSGSCQTQTTTTTTSSTTSTTTSSTTSTSTTTPTTTTSTTTPMCLPNGDRTCTADTQCCSNICNQFPGSTSICDTCRPPGGSCAAGEPCCNAGSSCENGITCCTPTAEGCTDDSECCEGLFCDPDLGLCIL
jgi:hypothetical protein